MTDLLKNGSSVKQWPEFHSMVGPQFLDEADSFSGLEFPAVSKFSGNQSTIIPVIKLAETEETLSFCKTFKFQRFAIFQIFLKILIIPFEIECCKYRMDHSLCFFVRDLINNLQKLFNFIVWKLSLVM